jgi:hypothetical protein
VAMWIDLETGLLGIKLHEVVIGLFL